MAFKQGLARLELDEAELMSSASQQIQKQFYQEAGIKAAVFMGCKSGEIEMGMQQKQNYSPCNLMDDTSLFSMAEQNFMVQHQQLLPHCHGSSWPHSSAPSSPSSLSVGSPELISSILFLDKPTTTADAPPLIAMQAYLDDDDHQYYGHFLQLPETGAPPPGDEFAIAMGAFKPYHPAATASSSSAAVLTSSQVNRQRQRGQEMIMILIGLARSIEAMRKEAMSPQTEQCPTPTTSQLQHMISERKRREKLNDSFHVLRTLLPPGTKKDKASVLASTKDHLSAMKARVEELEEKNRELNRHLSLGAGGDDDEGDDGDLSEAVTVKVAVEGHVAPECSSSSRRIDVRISSRQRRCDVAELVERVLKRLKKMPGIGLLSLEARSSSSPSRVSARVAVSLHVQDSSNWDEESFKAEVAKAAGDATSDDDIAAGAMTIGS